jgi:tryptophan synthase beta chain
VGPELSYLKDTGRLTLRQATDREALDALGYLARTEGIIPALETAHAVHAALAVARELGPKGLLVINVSGRGDKDVDTVRKALASGTVVPKAQEARMAAAARPRPLGSRRRPRSSPGAKAPGKRTPRGSKKGGRR